MDKSLLNQSASGVSDSTMVPFQEPTASQTFQGTGEIQKGIEPTRWDKFWDTAEESLLDETTSFAFKRYIKYRQEKDFTGTKLTPDEANKRFPGLPEPFTNDVDPVLAQFMYDEFKRRQEHQAWMSRGPALGAGWSFLAGAGASIVDPINVGLNLATGGLLAAAKIPMKFATVLTENMVQTVATEAFVRAGLKDEQQPRSAEESALNIAMGGVGGTAAHYGFKLIGSFTKARAADIKAQIRKMPPGRVQGVLKRLIMKHESGQKLDIAAETAEYRPDHNYPDPQTVDPGVAYSAINHPSEREFYVSQHGETGTDVQLGADYGGRVIVDHPTHARNMATGDDPALHGTVRRVSVDPSEKFLSLDSPVSDGVAKSLANALEQAGLNVDLPEGATIRDLLDSIKEQDPDNLVKVKDILQKEGFSGYTEVIQTPVGKANAVHLFENSRAEMSDPIPVSPDKIGKQDPARGQVLQDDANSSNIPDTPSALSDGDKLTTFDGQKATQFELSVRNAELELSTKAETDSFLKQELQAIDRSFKNDEKLSQALAEAAAFADDPDFGSRLLDHFVDKGVSFDPDDVAGIVDHIAEIKSTSIDPTDLSKKLNSFLQEDVISWPIRRRQERIFNLSKIEKLYAIANQTRGRKKKKDVVANLIDGIQGGGRIAGFGVNQSTDAMSDAHRTMFMRRLREVLGKNLRLAESGLLEREITQEMAALENGWPSGSSGNKEAAEIAKVYHQIKEELFAVKAGYSPFLEKIDNYFYKQTHDRGRIASVSKAEWVIDAYRAFGSSFTGKPQEDIIKRLGDVYEAIIQGRYHSSIFDKVAGDHNLSFRLANKRSLRASDWRAFYEYNVKYGKNVHLSMIDMIESASRDIAVMSHFGSTPHANVQSVIKKLTKDNAVLNERFKEKTDKILDAMHVATFAYNAPAVAMKARITRASQMWLQLVANGATWLRSLADFASATTAVTDMRGGSYLGNFASIASGYVRRFATKNSKLLMEEAELFGAFAESANRNLYLELGASKELGTLDKALRLHSKLSLADRGRNAMTATIGEIVSRDLANNVTKAWKDLPDSMRASLQRYGITQSEFKLLKHGIEEINGKKYLTPDALKKAFLKYAAGNRLDVVGIKAPDILEPLPGVIRNASDSGYRKPGSNYYAARDVVIANRDGGQGYGVNLEPVAPFNVDSSAKVATSVFETFSKAGYPDSEANTLATLYSSFFDSVGKLANKDPLEFYEAFKLKVERRVHDPGVLGELEPFRKKINATILSARPGVPMDKTIIHESAHFFLETLRDVKTLDGLDDTFKNELDDLWKWLGHKDGQIPAAGHEQFSNSFEAFIRTNEAPTPKLEKVFATLRDWYRRVLDMFRRGLGGMAESLGRPERAPEHIETFYKKLLGGEGPSQLKGPLSYKPETMSADELYSQYVSDTPTILPSQLTDLILKTGAIINDMALMSTTSPGAKQRAFMYGRSDINTWRGALWRAAWQFKSSTLKSFDTLARSYYSNPAKPDGDMTKIMKFALLSMGLYTMQKTVEDAISGKTPEDPTTVSYALKALAFSGAGSVLGDTLANELIDAESPRDFTTGILRSLVPAGTRALDAAGVAGLTVKSWIDDDTKFPASDFGRQVVNNTPFQNLFYTKGLMHFYLLNSIREEMSSGFLGNLERRVQKKEGLLDDYQDYFMLRPSDSFNWIRELY